ncbi:TRAP-type C4-dicarboxylate transport system substrate-binding protein [Breoghania corrubedonensis]|uniref:TRAP-type C4-dicarboxylate transport system substrate-binding protein n=1 Tax=Breoghania corrubedonensis TaxID=665038 RepID=A0A2T5VB44_9HYPH|nr:TRAP transporter substrate-binding protein [Breoghania corrubedonensis]PTW60973.1 TRAP-type C4-dicarboxylate transport system substrate-binding protein [Breoghania corrubedonensis]
MKFRSLATVAGAIAIACATMTPGASSAADVTLKLHHLLGPKAPAHTQMLEPWAKRVEASSGGKIKIDIYPSMSLGGKPPQLIGQVRDGVVDIIWTVLGYTAGQFPRSEVFELPFIHTNNLVATNLAMREMLEKGAFGDEFADVHVIALHVHAGQAIHMVDTPVRTPQDLEGKKMRIPTRTGAWILEALGANPVGMPVPDLPQALSKKVVDGALIPFEIVRPLKIQELTKYQTEGEGRVRFGTTTFLIAMNKAKYESLPDDLKKAIDDNSGIEFEKEIGRVWTQSEVGGLEALKEAGNEVIELNQDQIEAFRKKLEPVVERWVADVEAKGIDGRTLVDTARATIAKYANEK